MKKLSVISAILEEPSTSQKQFNEIISDYNSIVKGRLGIPFNDGDVGVICLTAVSNPEVIDEFTEKLSKIKNVTINKIYSGKDIV